MLYQFARKKLKCYNFYGAANVAINDKFIEPQMAEPQNHYSI